jgi:hypothetical protein
MRAIGLSVAVAVTSAALGAASAEAQVHPCRLLGRAEVRAATGTAVTAVIPRSSDGGSAPKCEFSVAQGGVTVMVQGRDALEGRSVVSWLDGMEPKLPFRPVRGIGDEAYLASTSMPAIDGQSGTLTSTLFFVARQGAQLLSIVVIVNGKGPSSDAIVKLGRRALLRLAPSPQGTSPG